MIKQAGHFLKDIVDPMIDKLGDLLFYAEKVGLPIDEDLLRELFVGLAKLHIKTLLLQILSHIIIAGVVCWTILQI